MWRKGRARQPSCQEATLQGSIALCRGREQPPGCRGLCQGGLTEVAVTGVQVFDLDLTDKFGDGLNQRKLTIGLLTEYSEQGDFLWP